MNCPECGAEFDLENVQLVSDELNEFGRRQLTFVAEGTSWIRWNPKKKMYSCLKCNIKFSKKEGALQ